jgi:putative sterol carrier protein
MLRRGMARDPGIDLDASPAELYAAITSLDDDAFDALMDDPVSRDRVIDTLVTHLSGQFRPEKAGDLEAVIHVKLWDRPGGGYDHRELVIAGGTCTVSETPEREPRLTLKVRPSDLRRIVTGDAGPRRLALRGRLRVIGDLGLGMRLTELFAL